MLLAYVMDDMKLLSISSMTKASINTVGQYQKL
jgi:hypothetical protein